MKIDLRNLKHFPSGSQETNCFTTDIWIDGKKAGYAENSGHGGMTNVQPHACLEKLNAYAATLSRVTSEIKDETDPSGFYTYQPDGESLVNDLVEKTLIEKHVRRILSKRVIYTIKGKKGLFQTKVIKAAVLKTWLGVPTLAAKLGADKILNLLPIEDAVALFTACGGKGED